MLVRVKEPWARYLLKAILISIIYVVVGKFGLSFALINQSATAIWAPTGIAIAALLFFGYEYWPAILLGAWITNLTTAGSIITTFFIATGNTLEALVGAYLTNKFAQGKYVFEHSKSIFLYSVLAGLAATMVSATIGTATLFISRLTTAALLPSVWMTWWLGDMGGALVVAPLVLLWMANPRIHWQWKKAAEFLVLVAATIAVSVVIFTGVLPFAYLVIPVLIWSVFRFGSRETAGLVLVVAVVATKYTISGMGPFAGASESINESLIYLQLFLSVMMATKLTVAAIVEENRKTGEIDKIRERHFRSLIEKSADVIALIDDKSIVNYVSPSIEEVLGYSTQEFTGITGLSIVHPDDLKVAQDVLGKVLVDSTQLGKIEVRVKQKDGSWKWVEAVVRNLMSDEAVKAIVVNFRDIKERKELEEGKNEFLMIAAHQLRAPLTSMRWNLELLLEQFKSEKTARDKVEIAYEQNLKMILLVNELLGVTRITKGKIQNEEELIDISGVILRETTAVKELAKRSNIKLSIDIAKRLPEINIDQRHLAEVMQNLISNALKYNHPGGSIEIAVSVVGKTLQIVVEDTGIGISAKDQTKLFKKFFRANDAIKTHKEGTGLGLYLVKTYVDIWKGKIEVKSPVKNDVGTRFTIAIPIK